jgi:hypothetical protein
MLNTIVERSGSENTAGILRRFSRKAQTSGVVKRVRSIRYAKRTPSPTRIRREALTRIKRTEAFTKLAKLGREPKAKGRRS